MNVTQSNMHVGTSVVDGAESLSYLETFSQNVCRRAWIRINKWDTPRVKVFCGILVCLRCLPQQSEIDGSRLL